MSECFEPSRGLRAKEPCELCYGIHLACARNFPDSNPGASHSECCCWRFPFELFLLIHEYRLLAIQIFYSSNHFYVMSYINGKLEGPQYDTLGFPTFIQRLPFDAIPYLRSLQFIVPECQENDELMDFLKPVTQDAYDWTEDISILSQHATLSRVTITVDESFLPWDGFDTYETPGLGLGQTNKLAWKRDQRIIRPISKLQGLKDFYVHLSYPRTVPNSSRMREMWAIQLEQRIMGPNYDSVSRGKYANRSRVSYRHCELCSNGHEGHH